MKIDPSASRIDGQFRRPVDHRGIELNREPDITGNRYAPNAPHNVFAVHSRKTCAIAVESDAEWLALAAAMGRQDLAARPDLRTASGRLAAVDEIEAVVASWCAVRPAAKAAQELQTAGVPAARVSSARDLVESDTQLVARGFWQHLDHPEMGPSLFTSPPFRLDDERVELVRPPLFGEHTEQVLTGALGMSREEIAALAERKILA